MERSALKTRIEKGSLEMERVEEMVMDSMTGVTQTGVLDEQPGDVYDFHVLPCGHSEEAWISSFTKEAFIKAWEHCSGWEPYTDSDEDMEGEDVEGEEGNREEGGGSARDKEGGVPKAQGK